MTIVTQHSNRCGTGTITTDKSRLSSGTATRSCPIVTHSALKQMMLVALVLRIK